jgi:REP element-mobilizing transposase RayT
MAETANLMWLKDVSRAAQHLTQLTLESSAQAALITREDELWAYAGQLSREAAQELGQSIQRYWNKESESDLLRFVRLEATEAQHMLYARKLSSSMILALVFDAETPFSTIRAQAGKLVRTLAEPHLEDLLAAQVVVKPQAVQSESAVLPPAASNNYDEEAIPSDLPPISELLGDVPPPNPVRQAPAPKTQLPWEQPKVPTTPSVAEPLTPAPIATVQPAMQQMDTASPTADMAETRLSSGLLAAETRVSPVKIPSELQETRRQNLDLEEIQEDPQSYIETRAQSATTESVTQAAHRILLEPASPALVNLTYACLLIPRFDTHHLVGDPAERLTEWVPQLCIAFGWRLEHLSVRPDYLQWVVRVPPSTAPGYIMRIVRQQTSDRLFGEFTRYKKENPSGDFWAPGYLIMGSSQPHPQKLVRDFVRQTRQRQGLEH